MADTRGDPTFDLVDNKKAKAFVWRYFGFPKSGENVDKTRVGCRLCKITLKYSGNTTNLTDHIRRKHSTVPLTATRTIGAKPDVSNAANATSDETKDDGLTLSRPASASTTSTMHSFFGKKLESKSQRSIAITDAITQFIVKDLRPYSVVMNKGFKNLLSVIEPKYIVPSRQYFSDTAVPELYNKVKEQVKKDLSKAVSVSLTTDGWTSCATESYVTITSSHINEDWEIKNYVLQTRAMPESHTGVNIAAVLKEAILEWGIPENPPLVTDNASNMTSAASEAGLTFHIGCYAHTLNLACGRALKLNRVARLLARIRRIVAYFHRSSIATMVLKQKQKLLQIPGHKLIVDVQTRWNSALDMIERFLEQQPAVYAALTSKELRGKERDIATLAESDIEDAEELVKVLTPLKMATVALCEETVPTLSVIRPFQHSLLSDIMIEKETDESITQIVKRAVVNDLSGRYQNKMNDLTLASLLDPRFKTVPFLSDQQRLETFHLLEMETLMHAKNAQVKQYIVKKEPEESPSISTAARAEVPELPQLPASAATVTEATAVPVVPAKMMKLETCEIKNDMPKKTSSTSAMSSLLGDLYIVKVEKSKSLEEQIENEVKAYKAESPIPTENNPLVWWSNKQKTFPHLALLAKKYLSIPATSVPSERVFSTAGDIVTAQRSALRSENVDQLIFLKKNWRP